MITIILAGGLGKRMKSSLPKVLHKVNDKPMIYHVIRNALYLGSTKILIIVGKYRAMIQKEIAHFFPDNNYIIEYINQEPPLGTGHAIQCAVPYLLRNQVPLDTNVLILSGDVPLITETTLVQLCANPNTLLITKLEEPKGCGRIIFAKDKIVKIIEEKDCTEEERQIQYVNCGIYNITVKTLLETVPFILNQNKANEFYLTDFVDLAIEKKIELNYYDLSISDQYQVININTEQDLVRANEILFVKQLY